MPILNRLKKGLLVEEQVFYQNENAIQQHLASRLRHAAISNLAEGRGVVARHFRGEYLASGLGQPSDFLREQARNGTWGTYIEATSLGETLGCHVVVTPVKNGVAQAPICLHRTSDDKAPTVHLYNSNNTHWYVNSKTKGDGNCLYNAFAQALQQAVKPELPAIAAAPAVSMQPHFFNTKVNTAEKTDAIQSQRLIEAAIRQQPTPAAMEASFQQEKARISGLPKKEQQQIADDYQFALKLAHQEMGYANKNVFSITEKSHPTLPTTAGLSAN